MLRLATSAPAVAGAVEAILPRAETEEEHRDSRPSRDTRESARGRLTVLALDPKILGNGQRPKVSKSVPVSGRQAPPLKHP